MRFISITAASLANGLLTISATGALLEASDDTTPLTGYGYSGYHNCDSSTQIADWTNPPGFVDIPATLNAPVGTVPGTGQNGAKMASYKITIKLLLPGAEEAVATKAAVYYGTTDCGGWDQPCAVKAADTEGFSECVSPPKGQFFAHEWIVRIAWTTRLARLVLNGDPASEFARNSGRWAGHVVIAVAIITISPTTATLA